MTKNLVIIGAGEFAREVYTWTRQAIDGGLDWRIRGFLDDRPDALAGFKYDARILSSIDAYTPQPDDVFLCAIGVPRTKKEIFERFSVRGAQFTTLVHPTALVGHDVAIGPGCLLCPFTQLSCDIVLGRLVTFGTFSNTGHDTAIGDFAQISGSCEINGRAVVEEGAFLGSHATILPSVRIGAYSYVGAGSVVLKRVRPGVKVFGNPATPIGQVSEER